MTPKPITLENLQAQIDKQAKQIAELEKQITNTPEHNCEYDGHKMQAIEKQVIYGITTSIISECKFCGKIEKKNVC